MLPFLLLYLGAYLAGSLPFGLWVARARGVDIRAVGSGNIGATNVFRCVGKGWGLLVFALDFLKGLLPALAPRWIWADPPPEALLLHQLGAGALAILGHTAPIFLGFRGGKGVATSAGALAGATPWALLPALGVWALAFAATRLVSVASLAAALAVGICGWVFYPQPRPVPLLLTALAALVIWRHRSNIQRLLRGEEHTFRKERTPPPPAGPSP
jgi:glycerol-3-phosphate acyltransferase PlsY